MPTSNASHTFTMMVDNEFGVLTRITSHIRRAGWNIRSLAVAETAVPELSRLTITLECRHNTLENVMDRLQRLNCVKEVSFFSEETQVARELCILRVADGDNPKLQHLCGSCGAEVISREGGEAILSVCCGPGGADKLLNEFRVFGLKDVARTGLIALNLQDEKGGDA